MGWRSYHHSDSGSPPECREKLALNAAECAVRQDDHGVAVPRLLREKVYDLVDARGGVGLFTECGDVARESCNIESFPLRNVGAPERREKHAVGRLERGDVSLLVNRSTRSRAAGFEDGEQSSLAVFGTERAKRLLDRSRMMGEVVVDAHA